MTDARAPLDLRTYACPLTYVKTRIALERLATGEVLEVWLAAGEAVESVPRSAAEDGHRVVGVRPLEGGPARSTGSGQAFRVLIEKGVGEPEAIP